MLLSIKSLKQNKVIFSGCYQSTSEALEDAVAQGVDLSYANLRNENLSGANLDEGYFCGADFTGTNLTGANLSEANLSGAVLDQTSLYNTCLAYADLSKARFEYTVFGGTDITGTNLGQTSFFGRSCFTLPFILASNLEGASYITDDGKRYSLSTPPYVILGAQVHPLVVFRDCLEHKAQFSLLSAG